MNHLKSKLLEDIGVVHGFFTREGGVSDGEFASLNVKRGIGDDTENIEHNRQIALNELDLPDESMVFANELAHSNRVYEAKDEDAGYDLADHDAIITSQKSLPIGLSTADCMAILLADKNQKAVAVVHAGWRGLKAQVIAETIKSLEEKYDIASNDLIAAISPAISVENYEIGEDLAKEFPPEFIVAKQKPHLDIVAMAKSQLSQAGVEAIDVLDVDTFSDDRFFSHRAENGKTGRQLTVISL